ncbi:MAG: ribbon-helix-helix domain-containing protein [Thermoplasmatota archaeon]
MTIKITPKLIHEIDHLIEEGWYTSRSEAVRDAVRELVERKRYLKTKEAIRSDIEWGLYGE